MIIHMHSEDSDQIEWMCMLVLVFARRACHVVHYAMSRSISSSGIIVIDKIIDYLYQGRSCLCGVKQ